MDFFWILFIPTYTLLVALAFFLISPDGLDVADYATLRNYGVNPDPQDYMLAGLMVLIIPIAPALLFACIPGPTLIFVGMLAACYWVGRLVL